MITLYDAIKHAREHFDKAFNSAQLVDVRLEGVTPSPDGKAWLVTFGFRETATEVVRRGGDLPEGLWEIDRPRVVPLPRVYKTIHLDKSTGDLLQIPPFTNTAA